ATFYISRTGADEAVTIVDPRGNSFTNVNFPPGVKWFRGSLFDVVTIKQPLPGRWAVSGVEEAEGFATLLTELKLQVRWPESNLTVGDSVVLMVRLTENGEPVRAPGIKEVTFYTYKIVNSSTGQLVVQGSLNDKAEEGDTTADDGIYSTTIKLSETGEYKALIAVAGPTFSRQQHISFNVSTGIVNLILKPENDFTGEEGAMRVELSETAKALKKLKVQLIARQVGEKKAVAIPLEKFERDDGAYDVPLQMLKEGEYELHARVSGTDPKTKEQVSGQSDTLTFKSEGATEELVVEGEAEDELAVEVLEETEEEEETSPDLYWGLGSVVLALAWVGGLGFFFYRRNSKENDGVSIDAREAYVIPPELEARVQAVREKTSAVRRKPSAAEIELFKSVESRLQAAAAAADDDGSGETGEGADEAEEAGDPAAEDTSNGVSEDSEDEE
ncbi:MAG: hypothetical protein KDD69_14295, partial [Bdellovibrionales bacterium]|nr:hypothetical protein [Bdellovibrionales bacterium]